MKGVFSEGEIPAVRRVGWVGLEPTRFPGGFQVIPGVISTFSEIARLF
jgi:hypothetical protein